MNRPIDIPKPAGLELTQLGAEWLTVRAGGLNRYAEGLSRALAARGVSQRWLVMGEEDLRPSDEVHVEAVARPGDGLLGRWRAMQRAWNRQAAASDAAVSHFALYAYPVRKHLKRTPHVVQFHGPWAEESDVEGAGGIKVRLKRHVEKAVYATGDRFITLSQAFADILAERYGVDPARIRIIPGGVDVERFDTGLTRPEARERLGWDQDRPTLLCVRRLVRRMGLESLIESMRAVLAKHPEALLLVAGKGPISEELGELIQRRGLRNSVRLLGFVPDEDLPIAYRAADLSIVPTQSLEGFGLIIPESFASGTPALVTPVGGMPEVVRGLDPGLILQGAKTEDLAAGLLSALDNPSGLPSDAVCQAYARERFSWPVIAEQILEVYREAIADYA